MEARPQTTRRRQQSPGQHISYQGGPSKHQTSCVRAQQITAAAVQREKARLVAAFRSRGGECSFDMHDNDADGTAAADLRELTVLRGRCELCALSDTGALASTRPCLFHERPSGAPEHFTATRLAQAACGYNGCCTSHALSACCATDKSLLGRAAKFQEYENVCLLTTRPARVAELEELAGEAAAAKQPAMDAPALHEVALLRMRVLELEAASAGLAAPARSGLLASASAAPGPSTPSLPLPRARAQEGQEAASGRAAAAAQHSPSAAGSDEQRAPAALKSGLAGCSLGRSLRAAEEPGMAGRDSCETSACAEVSTGARSPRSTVAAAHAQRTSSEGSAGSRSS